MRGSPNLRVLIVDDNAGQPPNSRRAGAQLGDAADAVDGGHAAIEALTAAAREGQPFDLVLLDANMPGSRRLRRGGRAWRRCARTWPGSTIMMLSSSGLEGDVARCRALGIAAYLTKPIKASDLLEAICHAPSIARRRRRPGRAPIGR